MKYKTSNYLYSYKYIKFYFFLLILYKFKNTYNLKLLLLLKQHLQPTIVLISLHIIQVKVAFLMLLILLE